MPTIKDTAATSALNEDQYINKLYDATKESQQKTLQDNYTASTQQLSASQEASKSLSDAYKSRTQVEAPGVNNGAYVPLSSGTAAGQRTQAALSFGNQGQRNITQLNQQQQQVDQEYERQRKLLADQYASAIKQAQADNDMARAQQLYEAAKAEEQQLQSLRQQGANLLAEKDDLSLWEALVAASGTGTATDTTTGATATGAASTEGAAAATGLPSGVAPQRDTTTATWDGVTRNEESLNAIYDAMLESQRLQAQSERDTALSDLLATQQARQRKTDQDLTQAYVDALRSGRNYQEVQNAYGQGSGTAAQAQLARANQLTGELTDLRTQQMAADAQTELDRLGLIQAYGDQIAASQADIDRQRNDALYGAAAAEQQALIELQQTYGQLLADKNQDYTVLGALYGLTPEQMAVLMPVSSGGGGDDDDSGRTYRRYTGKDSGGTDAGGNAGTSGGGTVGANQSVLNIGAGPISSNTLTGLISTGKANVNTDKNGTVSYSKGNGSPIQKPAVPGSSNWALPIKSK